MTKYAKYWTKAPDHVQWIATDWDGYVRGFERRPTPGGIFWWKPSESHASVVLGMVRPPISAWRESLEHRPGGA
jgi:hypothetical protein